MRWLRTHVIGKRLDRVRGHLGELLVGLFQRRVESDELEFALSIFENEVHSVTAWRCIAAIACSCRCSSARVRAVCTRCACSRSEPGGRLIVTFVSPTELLTSVVLGAAGAKGTLRIGAASSLNWSAGSDSVPAKKR